MAKIIGNTTATPNPKPDWSQTDSTKANYIKNKPFGTEIIITPVGELYADDGTLYDSSVYMYNHSLGMVIGETYTATTYTDDTVYSTLSLMAIDGPTLGSEFPKGSIGIGMLDSSGAISNAVGIDKVFFDYDNQIFSYSDSHCMIVNMDDAITKIVIEGLEGTYERVVYHKLPNEYVDISVDKTFNSQSYNAQSGVAVEQAIDDVTNKFPYSVITQLSTPTTLGDQHIKVSYAGGNGGTHPTSSFYNVYTEGIGLNSDLKTAKKDTLVNAINEIYNDVEENSTAIKENSTAIEENSTAIEENSTAIEEIFEKTTMCLNSNNSIIYKYNSETGVLSDILQKSTQDLNDGQSPEIIYNYLPIGCIKNKDDVLVATIRDGLAILCLSKCCIYLLTKDGITLYKDFSDADETFKKSLADYILNTSYKTTLCALYMIEDKTYHFYTVSVCRNKSEVFHNIGDTYTIYTQNFNTSTLVNQGLNGIIHTNAQIYTEQGIGSSTIKPVIIDKVTGLPTVSNDLHYGTTNGYYLKTYVIQSEDTWDMISSYTYGYNEKTFYYVINGETFSYTDSRYLYGESQYSLYYDELVCINSQWEIVYKNKTDGSIIKTVKIPNVTDVFSPLLPTIVHNNTLYMWDRGSGVLYSINLTLDVPQLNKISIHSKTSSLDLKTCCMKIIGDILYLPIVNNNGSIIAVSLKKQATLLQSDWTQNDPTDQSYIQNRPFYSETITTDYIPFTYSNIDSKLGEGTYKHTIGLELGKNYTVDIITETETNTVALEAIEMSGGDLGNHSAIGLTLADTFTLYDGVVVIDKDTYASGDGAVYTMNSSVKEVRLHDFDDTNVIHHKIPAEYIEQGDWDENDPESLAYIKNRTHYKEEIERDYVTLEHNGTITDTVSKYNKQLGLVEGQTYTCDLYSGDTLIKTIDIVSRVCPLPIGNNDYIGAIQLIDEEGKYLSIVDGVDFVEDKWVFADCVVYEFYDSTISKVCVHGCPSIETIVHKMSNEYIELDDKLDEKSTNAIQNAIVTKEIQGIKNNVNGVNLTYEGITRPNPAYKASYIHNGKSLPSAVILFYIGHFTFTTSGTELSDIHITWKRTNLPPVKYEFYDVGNGNGFRVSLSTSFDCTFTETFLFLDASVIDPEMSGVYPLSMTELSGLCEETGGFAVLERDMDTSMASSQLTWRYSINCVFQDETTRDAFLTEFAPIVRNAWTGKVAESYIANTVPEEIVSEVI